MKKEKTLSCLILGTLAAAGILGGGYCLCRRTCGDAAR